MEVAAADSRRQRLNVAGRRLADVANPDPERLNWAGKRAYGSRLGKDRSARHSRRTEPEDEFLRDL
jgi:hypothetical protein